MDLFGWQFKRKIDLDKQAVSFVPKEEDDGALVIAPGNFSGTYIDLSGTVRTEAELVTKYREMALQPEMDMAIDEIVNEIVSIDEDDIVNIVLDNVTTISEPVKKAIRAEFKNVTNLLGIQKYIYEIIRRWYIDGRLYYHVIIDDKAPLDGIKELRYIDPRKIRKIREVAKKKIGGGMGGEAVIPKTVNEYYMFNDKGFNYGNKSVGPQVTGIRIARDSIVQVVSGLTDTQGTMVLSYMHKAIKAMQQLRTLEDALVIYRLVRAPERRIWYIDVGNLPKVKAEQYVRDIMVKHKNRLIYDASDGCFAMDTRIPLLDGRILSIKEIEIELSQGKRLWAYSCDPKTGKFAPGLVTWAGVTHKSAKVMKLTFDNDKSVICTLTHKFPTWDSSGGFIEAKDLVVGQSMIPFYTKETPINSKETHLKYQQIFDNENKVWKFTHREVSKWKDENFINNEWVYNDIYNEDSKNTIHHIDFGRFNNTPENLIKMNKKDHWKYHHDLAKERSASEEHRENFRIAMKKYWTAERLLEKAEMMRNSPDRLYKLQKNANQKAWSNAKSDLRRAKLSEEQSHLYSQNIIDLVLKKANQKEKYKDVIDYINSNQELISEWRSLNVSKKIKNIDINNFYFKYKDILRICKLNGAQNWRELSKKEKYITYKDGKYIVVINNKRLGTFSSLEEAKNARQFHNHKVKSIEFLDNEIEVGTITIDGQEQFHNYHTFALESGVYTKNSVKDDRRFMTMTDDFWLPRREGGKGTEVTTLAGGQNLGSMDDVLYFQKKLYQTLNVPVNRLNSDALFSIGRATEVTRDEIKFSKFISRLRSKFSHLFTGLLEKQCVLKQIMSLEDWQAIANDIKYDFAKDMYFTELKDAEVLQGRISLFGEMEQNQVIGKYYSHDWVRKNVLKQTDEVIEEQDEIIQFEMQDPRWNPPIDQDGNPLPAGMGPDNVQDADAPQEEGGGEDDIHNDQDRKIQDARATVQRLRTKKNKTPEEMHKYKSATQILAKNK